MYLLNMTKEERININKAKAKLLTKYPELKRISDGVVINIIISKFLKE